jgi:type II secretory pathway pseudopilin PulG
MRKLWRYQKGMPHRLGRYVDQSIAESGDTLIEILVALVIIGLTVVALIGMLTTSVTSSAEYRSLSSVDTVLKGVAESMKGAIQIQSSGGSSYTNCAMSYQVVNEYPTNGVAGGYITVFGTGFEAGGPTTVTLTGPLGVGSPTSTSFPGPVVALPRTVPSFTDGVALSSTPIFTSASANFTTSDLGEPVRETDANGDIPSGTTIVAINSPTAVTLSQMPGGSGTISFALPARYGTVSATIQLPSGVGALTTGSYSVGLSDGTNSGTSTTMFNVASPPPGPTASAVAGYRVGIDSISWWNNATLAFDSPFTSPPATCTPSDTSGIEMIQLRATAPSNVSDTLQFVVTNPNFSPPPGPSVTVSAPATNVGGSLTFTATVTGSGGTTPPTPTGTIGWTFSGSPGNPTCQPPPATPNPSTLSSGAPGVATSSCTIGSARAGTYQATASYSGDTNYGTASGFGSLTVVRQTPIVRVSAPTTVQGESLVLTATLSGSGGVTPTGTVAWTFGAGSPGTPACQAPGTNPSSLTGTGNTATTTCTVPASGLGTYQVTASYSGDANYLPTTSSVTPIPVTQLVVTSVVLANGTQSSNPTPVAGKMQQDDSIAVTFSAAMNVATICPAWSGNTSTQTDSGGSVTVTPQGAPTNSDVITFSSTTCPNFTLGTINLGSNAAYVTTAISFTASTITYTWNPATNVSTVKIVLGSPTGQSQNRLTVASSTAVYTPAASLMDPWAFPVSGTGTTTLPQQF